MVSVGGNLVAINCCTITVDSSVEGREVWMVVMVVMVVPMPMESLDL
jgi:hypothetical protein